MEQKGERKREREREDEGLIRSSNDPSAVLSHPYRAESPPPFLAHILFLRHTNADLAHTTTLARVPRVRSPPLPYPPTHPLCPLARATPI